MHLTYFFTAAYLSLFGLAGVEFLKYKGVIARYVSVDFWNCVVMFLIGLTVARLMREKTIQDWWLTTVNNTIVLPVVALAAGVLISLESWNYTNFVFANLGVNYFILIDLLVLSFFFKIITSSKEYLKKYWQVLLFFAFLLVSFFLYSYYPLLFSDMSLSSGGITDDNFMEWLQVGVLAIGVGLSIRLAVLTRNNTVLRAIYGGGALLFILLIGEEISWGERLFSFVPLFRGGSNYQREFNLHNQEGLNELTAILYIAAFVYGVLSWQLRRLAEKRKVIKKKTRPFWDVFCFRGQEVLYLVPTFIVNPYADRTLLAGVPPILDLYYSWGLVPDFFQALSFVAVWRETFEVLFYAALVLHIFNIYAKHHGLKKAK